MPLFYAVEATIFTNKVNSKLEQFWTLQRENWNSIWIQLFVEPAILSNNKNNNK